MREVRRAAALDVVEGSTAAIERFGLGEHNTWRVTDLVDDGLTRFRIRQYGREVCEVRGAAARAGQVLPRLRGSGTA